jgi:hypothetical protein
MASTVPALQHSVHRLPVWTPNPKATTAKANRMNSRTTLQPTTHLAGSLQPNVAGAQALAPRQRHRSAYLTVLTWAFTLFNTLRAVAYLPTMWAIYTSGDSSQHSLWTWCTWLGANATMAAWLYEQNGQRLGRAVVVNIGNAAMCAVTVALILAHRSVPL